MGNFSIKLKIICIVFLFTCTAFAGSIGISDNFNRLGGLGVGIGFFGKKKSNPELITDGTFTAACGVNWTCGTGWTIADNKATATAATGNFDQGGLLFEAGKTYVITYTISGYSSGDTVPRLTGAANNSGTWRNSNGTFTDEITSTVNNSIFRIVTANGFTASISNVSVKEK